jgi:putative hydrolase of the HAD superfamily
MSVDPSALRAICFDLDHTLFDRELAMKRYLETWLARHNHEPEPALIARALEVDRAGYAPRRVFNQWWAGELGERGEQMTMDEFWQDFKANLAVELVVDEALCVMLKALGERYAIALVTNGGAENQRAKITALGLDKIFTPERIIVSDEVGHWKPEPEIFTEALGRLGEDAAHTLFVGDDPASDIAGAAHVGIMTCWVSRERAWPERMPRDLTPDMTIARIEDIGEVL